VINEPIAIVGAACHYPDARSPSELWENILAGRRAFRRLPDCRLRLSDYLSDDPQQPDATYAAQAALITDYEFDRARFRVVGSTFRSADMAHWLALDVASRALADAGFADGDGLPKDQVGVLVGNSLTGEFSRANVMRLRWPYVRRTVEAALVERDWSPDDRRAFLESLETEYKAPFPPVGDETLAGGLSNTIAGRICNHFDLRGGGYTVDGACASSLLAIANACNAITVGDLEIAIAGGVDLSLDPFELIGFAKVGALAKNEMRVYDTRSAGFWPGEGCGLVVLMRASDAIAQGQQIYALIRGWGISSDGSGGITRPEVEGQRLALERAYRRAGFTADSIGYFEGHGTGTNVGDATELEAVLKSRNGCHDLRPAAIGSIKANIGHTKAAAGVAGLLKATLALHHQMLPPHVGWEQAHSHLTSNGASLELLPRGRPWPAELPLRAAVSAMGFGGINAHIVLEAAAQRRTIADDPDVVRLTSSIQDAELFLFAGGTREEVEQRVRRVASYAGQLSFAELTDLAAELSRSLGHGPVRAAVIASRPAELQRNLEALLEWLSEDVQQRLDIERGVFLATTSEPPSIGFLFPGQGSQTTLTGGAWACRFPFVHNRYDQAELSRDADTTRTEIAHPAIMTAELAGLDVLRHLGIEGTVGIGHSLGELAAYHWAGILNEVALVRLAKARGHAIAQFGRPGGAMAGIAAPSTAVKTLIEDSSVVVSGVNSPSQTVISGEAAALDAVVARAHAVGMHAVRLAVSHAFHSPLVADAVTGLSPALDCEEFQPAERLVASTITGGFLDAREDFRDLLRRQLTTPVRLMDAVRAAELKVDLWIEVGPGHVLRGIVGKFAAAPVVSLDAGGDSLKDLLRTVGAAFALGAPLDAARLFKDRFTRPFNLDWQAKFFVNPCELAPEIDSQFTIRERPTKTREQVAEAPRSPLAARSALEVVRQLVAERAELPVTAVQDGDQLLQDLHFSSISVGSVVADAARALGLPPPVSPTDYARATVGEVAAALEELAQSGLTSSSAPESSPAGVDAWVRNFAVELVERPLTNGPNPVGAGLWQVIAPPDHELAEALQAELNERVSGVGVALCLPPVADDQQLTLLLQATRQVIESEGNCRFLLVEHGRGAGGWARTLHLEMPKVTTCVVNLPPDHPQAIDWIVAEARSAKGYSEAHYGAAGIRRVPQLRIVTECSGSGDSRTAPLGPDDVLLVTGGGKGIAAECALALARQYGVRLALLGRSQVGDTTLASPEAGDPQLEENLKRFAAAGAIFRYVSADVTDPLAVRDAVEQIVGTLGPVTAVLHGAGSNHPQSLRTLDEAAVRRTLGPKVGGLRNVLGAVNADDLRLLVTFGSIIARTGLHGEADYALANEWLADLTDQWHVEHPHCRCLTVEWSVWSGVGMGERLGRIDALRRQGITPITPDEGVHILRRLIASPPSQTAVVVSGRFGDPPTLRMEESHLPMLRFLEKPRVHVPGVELVADVNLSLGTDPYLRDHSYQDTPLLPAVMGLEAMAQITKALTGRLPRVFENVELQRPITVPEASTRTIRLAGLVRSADQVDVVLRSEETGFQTDHFRATCRLNDSVAPDSDFPDSSLEIAIQSSGANANGALRLALNPTEDLYGGILFHRGRFRRVEGYRHLSATRCLADVSPDGEAAWFSGYLPGELLLGDPALRDAAIHSIQACIPHGTILPIGIDRVTLAPEPLAGPCVVHAVERERDGDRFVYDLEIKSAGGDNCERWEGLQLRRVGQSPAAPKWIEPLLAPYLERRLAELVPGSFASIAVISAAEPVNAGSNRQSSDVAIATALDRNVPVYRRVDGRPVAECDSEISVAHACALTLAITSVRDLVACDAEAVAQRTEDAWIGLLQPEGTALARLIAGQSDPEQFDAAATRVWAAAECLKKAGLPAATPLMLRAATADDWVMLSAGSATVATWVGQVRGQPAPLAVALLVGSRDAPL
jgi:enediyne polyketide synthase